MSSQLLFNISYTRPPGCVLRALFLFDKALSLQNTHTRPSPLNMTIISRNAHRLISFQRASKVAIHHAPARAHFKRCRVTSSFAYHFWRTLVVTGKGGCGGGVEGWALFIVSCHHRHAFCFLPSTPKTDSLDGDRETRGKLVCVCVYVYPRALLSNQVTCRHANDKPLLKPTWKVSHADKNQTHQEREREREVGRSI